MIKKNKCKDDIPASFETGRHLLRMSVFFSWIGISSNAVGLRSASCLIATIGTGFTDGNCLDCFVYKQDIINMDNYKENHILFISLRHNPFPKI